MKTGSPGDATLRSDRVEWREEERPARPRTGPYILDKDPQEDERRLMRAAQVQQGVQMAVLAGYAAVVATGIVYHEPWADEAQAWLLARDQGFWRLMLHSIRYEGSPGLWHALLWALARMHVGYVGMHWAAGAIALAGVYVLLRWSPFPLILKALLPFGFWLAYQDAVVARSYVMFAVLAFPAAAILRGMSRAETPPERGRLIWLALLLGLMANLSLHGFIASVGFAIVALALLRRKARAGVKADGRIPATILCAFWLFMAITVFPPSDVSFPAGKNLQSSTEKIWAALGNKTAKAELLDGSGQEFLPGELPMRPGHAFQKRPGEGRWHRIAHVLGLLTFPVSNFRCLALATLALILVQAVVFGRSRGQVGWIGLLPWALMILVFTWMYLAPRHAGMIWEALLAALWVTWPAEPLPGPRLWLHRLTVVALALVAVNQVQWTAHSLWDDIRKPCSGDEAMAQWLKANEVGKRIAGFGYHTVGVTAWFSGPLYFNQPATYWIWSQKQRNDARAPFTLAAHPDVVVYGGWDWSEHNADVSEDWLKPDVATLNSVPLNDSFHIIEYAEARGYRETHRFCGHEFLRSGYAEELCQVALEPVQASMPGASAPALTPVPVSGTGSR